MICGGDEICRTQNGNNNAYCQDNELSWFHWDLNDRQHALFDFTRQLIEIRLKHPNLHRTQIQSGPRNSRLRRTRSAVAADRWRGDDGRRVERRLGETLGLMLNGRTLNQVSPSGDAIIDDTFLLLLNSSENPIHFTLPKGHSTGCWRLLVDTNNPSSTDEPCKHTADRLNLADRSLMLLARSQQNVRTSPAGQSVFQPISFVFL